MNTFGRDLNCSHGVKLMRKRPEAQSHKKQEQMPEKKRWTKTQNIYFNLICQAIQRCLTLKHYGTMRKKGSKCTRISTAVAANNCVCACVRPNEQPKTKTITINIKKDRTQFE